MSHDTIASLVDSGCLMEAEHLAWLSQDPRQSVIRELLTNGSPADRDEERINELEDEVDEANERVNTLESLLLELLPHAESCADNITDEQVKAKLVELIAKAKRETA